MRIIKNQPMFERLTQNIVANEMSNVAMVLQTPTILTTWYSVDQNATETLRGTHNVDDYIHKDSPVVYDRIENLPMYGIDNLVSQASFDEEVGFDEDYSSSGVIYPNTIFPKPYDCFTINNSPVTALYVVTDVKPVTVRSNPFIEISFRLLSRNPDTIDQLNKQVNRELVTAMSPIGANKSLVVTKLAEEEIQSHISAYLEIAHLYQMLFYDENKAAFVFDGYPDDRGLRSCYIDMTLWKFMFDEGVVIYDGIITHANNNGQRTIERVYTGCPDVYLDEHAYHRSILYRLYAREGELTIRRNKFDEYRFPFIYEPTSRITKFQGQNIWYLETYLNHPSAEDAEKHFYIWDNEFLCRIRQNNPYPEMPLKGGQCDACELHCTGAPVLCHNPYLRNVVINWFNGGEINWSGIEISDDKTVENYYLIPLVLAIYKKYIQSIS